MEELSLYNNTLRKDVFNSSLDDQVAPELSDVIKGTAPQIYLDPDEFFSSTYITDSMKRLVDDVSNNLSNGKGLTVPLFSLFGGGKTHSVIMIYHVFREPEIAEKYELSPLDNVKVIGIGGKDSSTAPSPVDRADVKTLWGYIAKQLGKYDLIKKYDDEMMSPTAKELEELFSGEKVILLFDEMVWYLSRIRGTSYHNYYSQCLNFFEVLASITTKLPVAFIITIAGEYKEDEAKGEQGYEQVVEELSKRILRVGSVYRAPIETDVDLANVLKKRIFEKINNDITDVIKKYSSFIDNFKEYVDANSRSELSSIYPFHPYYVSTLKRLVENVKGFQKTRDALKITRIVVRSLWNEKPTRSMVLPIDIKITDDKLKTTLIKDYQEYDSVIEIIGDITKDLDAYFCLADYIFLNTYYLRLGLDPGKNINALPDSKKVVTSILDPVLLNEKRWTPSDVKTFLDDLVNGTISSDHILPYLFSKNDRYWFTFYFDPRTMCKANRDKVPLTDAEKYVEDIVIKLAEIPVDQIDKGRKKNTEQTTILKLYLRVVRDIEQLIDEDKPFYHLVIIDKPICVNCKEVDNDVREKVKKFMYHTLSGNSFRKYGNTISVLFSLNNEELRNRIIEKAKEFISCEKIKEDIYQYYSDDVVRQKVNSLLIEYSQSLKNNIYSLVFQYYDHLAYPYGKNDVDIVSLHLSEKTLIDEAWKDLLDQGKAVDEQNIDYDDLMYYLEQINIKNIDGFTFSQLKDMFYSNSMLPWISDTGLKIALKDGVMQHKIGIQIGQKTYFKNGISEYEITESALILSDDTAAKKEIEELKKETLIEENGKKIKKYSVLKTQDGEEIPFSLLLSRGDWLNLYKLGEIEKKEEVIESDIYVNTMPRSIEGFEGEEKKIEIRVDKVGEFEGNVSLEVSDGEVTPKEGIPPFEGVLKVKLSKDMSVIRLKVKYDSNEKEMEIPVVVRSKETETALSSVNSNSLITEINILKFDNLTDVLTQLNQVQGVKTLNGELKIDNPNKVSLIIKDINMKLIEFVNFINAELSLVGKLNSTISGYLTVRISESKGVSDSVAAKLNDLISKGTILVKGK
jgi:predicted AAA+ superfamily ATPase